MRIKCNFSKAETNQQHTTFTNKKTSGSLAFSGIESVGTRISLKNCNKSSSND